MTVDVLMTTQSVIHDVKNAQKSSHCQCVVDKGLSDLVYKPLYAGGQYMTVDGELL